MFPQSGQSSTSSVNATCFSIETPFPTLALEAVEQIIENIPGMNEVLDLLSNAIRVFGLADPLLIKTKPYDRYKGSLPNL